MENHGEDSKDGKVEATWAESYLKVPVSELDRLEIHYDPAVVGEDQTAYVRQNEDGTLTILTEGQFDQEAYRLVTLKDEPDGSFWMTTRDLEELSDIHDYEILESDHLSNRHRVRRINGQVREEG